MSEKQPLLGASQPAAPYPPASGGPPPNTGSPYPPGQPGPSYQSTAPAPAGGMPGAGAPVAPAAGAQAAAPAMQGGAPSAPSLDNMEKVSGYEGTGFSEDNFLPPPTYDTATAPQPKSDPTIYDNTSQISEPEVRAALLEFVSQNCCYGKGAAREMSIDRIVPTNAFHYRLETFTESRRTAWQHTPFKGQPIDSCMNGVAPQAWEIQVPMGRFFEDRVADVEVPHTAYVKPCHNCGARGYNRCHHCHSQGYVFCTHCSGQGKMWHHGDGGASGGRFDRCGICHGTGRKSCGYCNGQGQIVCPVCRTYGSLKWFIKLTVTWKNHIDDHVVEATELPAHLIVNAAGKLAMEEDHPRLAPLTTFPDPNINAASARLVVQHASAYQMERVHRQRHNVRIVPISEAQFTFKDTSGKFWVYGDNRLVHAPDYPQQCCCGCTIL